MDVWKDRRSWIIALIITMSFRIDATMATLGSFAGSQQTGIESS